VLTPVPDLHLGWVSSARMLQLRPGQRATGHEGCEGGHRTHQAAAVTGIGWSCTPYHQLLHRDTAM
jgi:hypothetical protein